MTKEDITYALRPNAV